MPESDSGQRLPFREWMARALHDPRGGYYARRVRTVGRQGDFSTSATISTLLGQAIAAWITQERASYSSVRTIVEVGGGDGSLSAAVRDSLGWWQRRKYEWFMVETSVPLKEQQQSRLGAGHARWFNNLEAALKACEGSAFIFHNELLDAFLVTLLQWEEDAAQWQEVWLYHENGTWHDELRPFEPDVRVDTSHFGLLSATEWKPVSLRRGQRLELGAAARDWLTGWAPHWKSGSMLTLDYGDKDSRVYHRQPRGTLRAYFMHQRLVGSHVYENMGHQDITADVNFADLERWGRSLGWTNEPMQTQRQFLQRHVSNLDARASRDPAVAFLLAGDGAGTAFKALVQRPA